ncbi:MULTISPECIES: hypothetical protein [unclassified Methylosinus]|uniref:hypothetical protein n=1 Tax=unclassified Methylosinus TaxID=2624500 RepID=UPI00046549E9|nr:MULTISPECIES: hypothetical protein [unclassified Methylosinus]
MMKQRRRFSDRRLPILGRIAALLAVLLALVMSAAPGVAQRAAHADEASLTAATQEICELSHHASDHGEAHAGASCCCLQITARRDATGFVAILLGFVQFPAPDAPSFAARSDTSHRAGVALPTTPWLSRAPPFFS